jgi:hypothetical protein
MYFEILVSMISRLHETMEDCWIENTCCRNLIIDEGLMTPDQLEAALQGAKNDPVIRKQTDDHFAESRKTLNESAKQAAYELHLSEPPPTDKSN